MLKLYTLFAMDDYELFITKLAKHCSQTVLRAVVWLLSLLLFRENTDVFYKTV